MSAIPSSAMPHTFVHEDDEEFSGAKKTDNDTDASSPSAGMLIGGAIAAYLLYRVLR